MSEPDNIADLLKSYIKNKDLAKKINHHRLFSHWAAIVGNDIARHARPKMLRNKILFIDAENPVWATELGMMSQEIIEKINNFLADEVVTELRIKPALK